MANKGIGDPGYRNRPERSGLDPVESESEAGRSSGTLLANLLYGRIRVKSRWLAGLMALLGALLILPILLVGYEFIRGGAFTGEGFPTIIVSSLIGVLLLFNAIRNLRKPGQPR